jgi:hypothetical protein
MRRELHEVRNAVLKFIAMLLLAKFLIWSIGPAIDLLLPVFMGIGAALVLATHWQRRRWW